MREDLNNIWDYLCDRASHCMDCSECPFVGYDCLQKRNEMSDEELVHKLGEWAQALYLLR